MARITMRKTQETKLSEILTLYLASAAARGVKDKTRRTYEQHFNAISKRLDVNSNISQITSKDSSRNAMRSSSHMRGHSTGRNYWTFGAAHDKIYKISAGRVQTFEIVRSAITRMQIDASFVLLPFPNHLFNDIIHNNRRVALWKRKATAAKASLVKPFSMTPMATKLARVCVISGAVWIDTRKRTNNRLKEDLHAVGRLL